MYYVFLFNMLAGTNNIFKKDNNKVLPYFCGIVAYN